MPPRPFSGPGRLKGDWRPLRRESPPSRRATCNSLRPAVGLFVAMLACGAELETQHSADIRFALRESFELTLHTRFRVQPKESSRHQIRAGPILSWEALPRLTLMAGYYYYAQTDPVDRDYLKGHRLFGGAEATLWRRGRLRFDQRALIERITLEDLKDFNRYRFRSRLALDGAVAPYTYHEFFFDAAGWRSSRHAAAARLRLQRAVALEFGYFYEHRRRDVGPRRHVWFTSLNLR